VGGPNPWVSVYVTEMLESNGSGGETMLRMCQSVTVMMLQVPLLEVRWEPLIHRFLSNGLDVTKMLEMFLM
jgi:hypothetical protein